MKEDGCIGYFCEQPAGEGISCPAVTDKKKIEESYSDYTGDESKVNGEMPESIYFPGSTEETSAAVRDAAKAGLAIRVSGSRTGIVGGAVTGKDECIISLENVKREPYLNAYDNVVTSAGSHGRTGTETNGAIKKTVVLGAGVKLEELPGILQKLGEEDHYYPVDPTEMSASVGGTVATNASGARTLYYGPTRDWVVACTVVLPDGSVLRLRRGKQTAEEGFFSVVKPDGGREEMSFRPITIPNVKHTGGHFLEPDMDLIDLFIGSEGTLGIITEVELLLTKRFANNLYMCLFLPQEQVLPIVREMLGAEHDGTIDDAKSDSDSPIDNDTGNRTPPLDLIALEYMDCRSIDLLREYREIAGESSGVPVIPEDTDEVLYLEWGYETEEEMEEFFVHLEALLAERGLSVDDTWAGFTEDDLEEMKLFRHALPERINSLIAERKRKIPSLTKVSTDMAVPSCHLPEIVRMYNDTLTEEGLEYYIFGHIGNGHLHINILPRNEEEHKRALEVYRSFAEAVVPLGGSVSAEHGIGRLKKSFFPLQYSADDIEQMRKIKAFFDPAGRLNPGVYF